MKVLKMSVIEICCKLTIKPTLIARPILFATSMNHNFSMIFFLLRARLVELDS